MAWYQYVLSTVFVATLLSSIVFAVRSRVQQDPQKRGIFAARTNISMGIMLLSVASLQLIDFTMSWLRFFVLIMFALVGLFNLFAGLRSHRDYSRKAKY